MKDPRRLLEGDGSDIERSLLEAGRAELPNSFGKRRAAIALAIGAASVWPTAAGATAKITKAGLPVLVKLFAIGAVGVGTLGTAGYLATRPAKPATETTLTAPATPSPVRNPRAKAPTTPDQAAAVPVESLELEQAADPARQAPARAAATPRTSAPEASSIGEETRVIDEARRALESGDSAKAKRTLDDYQRKHPRGTFEDEAVLLKIEALSRSGNKDAARSLARSYRASHPNSPHLRRIDSLLAEP